MLCVIAFAGITCGKLERQIEEGYTGECHSDGRQRWKLIDGRRPNSTALTGQRVRTIICI